MTESILLSKIRRDGGTQMRAQIDPATVEKYAMLMAEGVEFDPVSVVYDGSDYWLTDGFHRVAAVRQLARDAISADVRPGTQRDAILLAAGANGKHGLHRTREDVQRSIEALLRDPEWGIWSDRVIADKCNATGPTVARVRRELIAAGTAKHLQSDIRKTADGREINTSNIGGKERPKPTTGNPYMTKIYKAWRKDFPEKPVLIDVGGAFVAIGHDDALVRRGDFAFLPAGYIGLSGSADYTLVTKIDAALLAEFVKRGIDPVVIRFADLDEDMQFVAGKAKNARNIPLATYADWQHKQTTGVKWFSNPQLQVVSGMNFADRYKAIRKLTQEDLFVFVLVGQGGSIALREDAKRAASILKLETVNTEFGEAIFQERRINESQMMRDLSQTHQVWTYIDDSPELLAFWQHHAVERPQIEREAARQKTIQPPEQKPWPETSSNANLPLLKVGDLVETRSGHRGRVVTLYGPGAFVETVNGAHLYKRENLTLLDSVDPQPEQAAPPIESEPDTSPAPFIYEGPGGQTQATSQRQLEDYQSEGIADVVPALRLVLDFLEDGSEATMRLNEAVIDCQQFFSLAGQYIADEITERQRMGLIGQKIES